MTNIVLILIVVVAALCSLYKHGDNASVLQVEVSRIFLHLDLLTPVGGSPPPLSVCNYSRLLGLTPGFSRTRKGELTVRIKYCPSPHQSNGSKESQIRS